MKKIIAASALIIMFYSASIAIAASSLPREAHIPTAGELNIQSSPINSGQDLTNVIIFFTRGLYTVFFIWAALFIILAAFSYLSRGDKPEKLKEVHNRLIWAAVGIAIALMAVGATQIIQSFLNEGGGGASSQGVPSDQLPYVHNPY